MDIKITSCKEFLPLGFLFAGLLAASPASLAEVHRVRFQANNQFLTLEFLRDDLLHFEVSAVPPLPTKRFSPPPRLPRPSTPVRRASLNRGLAETPWTPRK